SRSLEPDACAVGARGRFAHLSVRNQEHRSAAAKGDTRLVSRFIAGLPGYATCPLAGKADRDPLSSASRAHPKPESFGPAQTTVSISVLPEATMRGLLLICGYILLFLLVRDMGWQFSERSWRLSAPILVVGASEALLGLAQASNGQNPDSGIGTYV